MKFISKFITFCFIGGMSALIDFGVFNLFFWLDFGFIPSRMVAILFAIIYNFCMNRNITFSAKGQPIKKQVIRYGVVYFIAISINLFVSIMVVNILGDGVFNANIATVLGISTGIPFSFFGSLLWVFKRKDINK